MILKKVTLVYSKLSLKSYEILLAIIIWTFFLVFRRVLEENDDND